MATKDEKTPGRPGERSVSQNFEATESTYVKVFRASPDAISITRVSDGLFLEVNEGFCRLTGYTREEVLGHTTEELSFWDQDDRRRMVEALRGKGYLRSYAARIVMKSGAVRDCEVTAEVVELGGEPCLIAITRDVTRQKNVERALRASEERFSKAFRASPDAIMLTDLRDGTIIEVNEGFEQRTGYRREEAIGRTTQELNFWVQPDTRQHILEILEREGSIRDLRMKARTRHGSIRDCLFSGEQLVIDGVPYLVSITRDITEQKRAEDALRLSEEKFARAFRSSPDAILITTIPDGVILEVNDNFIRTSGYQAEEVLGKSTLELGLWVHLEERERMFEALRAEGRVRNLECTIRKKDGTIGQFLLSGEVIDIGGEQRLLTVVRDITEQKQAEAERERLIADLEAKNAELERFTYTVSHDLKSPIVTIKGFLGLIEQDMEAGKLDRARQDLRRIDAAANTMIRLLDELLELSRIGRIVNDKQEVSLSDLVQEAMNQVGAVIKQRGVEVRVDHPLPTVYGEKIRLLEVFQNLIDNAVKFMGDQPTPRIEISASATDDAMVHCRVADNGMGIRPCYHEKIFGLFERLDNRTEGTGIGLALVKRIVEVHGGRIWVASAGEGQGATFHFTLPAGEHLT